MLCLFEYIPQENLHWERFPSGCCDLNLGLFCHWRWTVIPNKSGNCLKRYHLICHDVRESDHKVAWMVCWASTSRTTVLNEDIQCSVTIWCPVGSVMSDLWMLSRKLIGKDTHHPVLFWFPPSFLMFCHRTDQKNTTTTTTFTAEVGDWSGLLARVKHFLVWWQICSVVEQSGTLDLLHEVDA